MNNTLKLIIKKIILFVFVVVFIIGGYMGYSHYQQPKRIHIFIDYATTPSILQMIEFIRLPEKDIKLIGWERFPNRLSIINSKNIQKNVFEFKPDLKKTHKQKYETFQKFLNTFNCEKQKCEYIIHANSMHFGWEAILFLQLLPKEDIKEVHLYEDGSASFYRYLVSNHVLDVLSLFEKGVYKFLDNPKLNWSATLYHMHAYPVVLSKKYPITLHTTFAQNVISNINKSQNNNIKKAKIESVDFRDLKNTLSTDEKEKLYQLTSTDFSVVKKYAQGNKPLGLFMWDGQYLKKRIDATNKCLDIMEENSKQHGTIWFSKNHPTAPTPYLPREFLKPLPPHIPMEILLLSDYPFQYVAGAGSSAFYSLKPDEIIAYMPNAYRYYKKTLIHLGILSKDKVIEW